MALLLQHQALTPSEKRMLPVRFLQAIAELALAELRLAGFDVELEFVSSPRMRSLNRRYRGKDKPTDVLSFPLYEAYNGRVSRPSYLRGQHHLGPLGSIVIAQQVARRQAAELGHSLRAEVARLLVHGVCHLAGYDHERSAREEKLQFAREDRILARARRLL